jgi:hypothetical protein
MQELRQLTFEQFLSMVRLRYARGKKKFTIFLPAKILPPATLEYRKTRVIEDQVVGARFYCSLNITKEGDWLIRVEVVEDTINPAISPGEAQEILKKFKK